jgi:hypothetical protein
MEIRAKWCIHRASEPKAYIGRIGNSVKWQIGLHHCDDQGDQNGYIICMHRSSDEEDVEKPK